MIELNVITRVSVVLVSDLEVSNNVV